MSAFQSVLRQIGSSRSLGKGDSVGESARVLKDQSQGPTRTIDEIRRKRLHGENYGRMVR